MPSLCVFCASSEAIDPRYRRLAADVGTAVARRGWTLVSGGGSVSMMGEVARAARRAGARTVGVIPEAMLPWEVADRDAHELVVTRDMRQRKAVMDERSDAFLALPGGIGTLEELVEAWTAASLGLHDKPVVVLDPWGDLAGLRTLVEGLVGSGFVRAEAAASLTWTATVPAALDAVVAGWASAAERGAPPRVPEWLRAEVLESD